MIGALLTGGDASVAQGYATVMAAAGDATVKQAGTQWLFAAGDVDVEYGGALLVAAPRVTMRRGFVGLARRASCAARGRRQGAPQADRSGGVRCGPGRGLRARGRVAFGTRSRK